MRPGILGRIHSSGSLRLIRRAAVIAVGAALAGAGLVLMPVPGPGGTPVFLAGLALLATEFRWARQFLARFKESYTKMDKKKRRVLTLTVLTLYIVSGFVIWSWANRPELKAAVTADA